MTFGALTGMDVTVLVRTIQEILKSQNSVAFLEIGVHTGTTARGLMEFSKDEQFFLDYTGIDCTAPDPNPPFADAKIIVGKSGSVYGQVDQDFDAVFIDACHCRNHVFDDIFHYAPKIKPGGFILLHDTAPQVQGVQENPWCEFGLKTFVNEGIAMSDLVNRGRWELWMKAFNGEDYGGMTVYWRLK